MRRHLLLTGLALISAVARPPKVAGAGGSADETLLILHKWGESLGSYDAVTGQRRGGLVRLGAVPHEMVLSADGRWLYVTNYGVKTYTDEAQGGNTISIVDVQRGAKVGEIALGARHRPHGIERGRSGKLYVTVDFPPSVVVVDPAARKVVADFPLDQKLPHMLAVSRDESVVYTANTGSASVTVLRPNAPPGPARLKNLPVGGVPMGVALSADDARLYVANRQGNAVVAIDTRSERTLKSIEIAGAPARVQLVPGDRQLVVTMIDAGDVALVDTQTFQVLKRAHVGERAEGLFVDGRGRFACVAAQGDNKVVKLALPSLAKMVEIPTDARPDPVVLMPGKIVFAASK
jgi:YVTN family beta-propeller protein